MLGVHIYTDAANAYAYTFTLNIKLEQMVTNIRIQAHPINIPIPLYERAEKGKKRK